MSIDTTHAIAGAGVPSEPPDRSQAERQEIRRLAQQFEAMLLTQMLREMRRSMLDEEAQEEGGLGAGPMTDIANVELGNELGRIGGLGLTDSLLDAFERLQTGQAGQAGQAGPAGQAGRAAADGRGVRLQPDVEQTISMILPRDLDANTPISSEFGWRQDPISGESRFHKGIDIALAYGHEVTAAASGTVSFAGTQGGYGQTVVVDHGDGRQTRYAHLSERFVKAGDRVGEGQVLAKSGNSGRTTGPHLHFEMLVGGRPVDPAGRLE